MTDLNALQPAPAQPRPDYVRSLRKQQLIGLVVVGFFAGTLGVWSMTTTLQGAVAAAGQFVVAGEVKKVQHPTGGVVGELMVRDGDRVKAGDVVLRLDETVARANYQIVSKQIDEFAVRSLRLAAERDGAAGLALTPEIESRKASPEIAQLIAAETRLFEVRRAARDGQRAQLRKRVAQLRDEIWSSSRGSARFNAIRPRSRASAASFSPASPSPKARSPRSNSRSSRSTRTSAPR